MKALKIVGIVLGMLLLLTGAGLLAGSVLVDKGKGAFEQELAKSGYVGPVEGTVQSVDQTGPVVVTVRYTDQHGKKQTGQGTAAGTKPPNVGDTVPTYYSTSDESQIVVVNVPGLGNLSAVASTLRGAGVGCLIAGGVLLLTGILGLVLGRKNPTAVATPPAYPTGSQAGYPMQQYPGLQQYPGQQPYEAQQPYPPQPPQYPYQQSQAEYPPQQYPPQQNPPQR
jgi:hypothetical protein